MTLVHFDRPPVVETVLGVEFSPLEGMSVPHFGLLWSSIRDDYPTFDVRPPIVDNLADPARLVRLEPIPPFRCWFINKEKNRLLQVQRDRFVHNWRKYQQEQEYPHYDENIRPKFEIEWRRFCEFLTTEGLGTPDVQQCEVTYINHIVIGEGWTSAADVADVTPLWRGETSGTFLPGPDSVAFRTTYALPDQQGRLYVVLEPVVRTSDRKQMLALHISARGKPKGSATQQVLEWLDIGREWVVRGFEDVTSSRMHDLWGRDERG